MSVEQRNLVPQAIAQMKSSESDERHDSEIKRADDPATLNPSGDLQNTESIVLEAVEQNPYQMSYTCLLLSRIDAHHLSGDVAVCVQTSLKHICTSFGWNLEFLSVEPTYLHWTIRVPPATATAHIMKVIREQTSTQLFTDFPRFKLDKKLDDFWAPGYLIFWGSQPHPIEIIQRFIKQTRHQQGL